MSCAMTQEALAQALAAQLGARLEAGQVWDGKLIAGDLVAEVQVRVTRRVAPDAAKQYRAEALAYLRVNSYLIHHCGCRVNRGGKWYQERAERSCQGRVVAVVVSKGFAKQTSFLFICGRHRTAHGLHTEDVLAVVDLPDAHLVAIRDHYERVDHPAAKARWEAEEAERAKAERRGGQ